MERIYFVSFYLEVITEDVDELPQRGVLVPVEVEELVGEDGVVVAVGVSRRTLFEHVADGLDPRPRDLGHILVLFFKEQVDGGASQIKQHQDEKRHVPH